MWKTLGFAILGLVLVVAGLFASGYRLALDGSGKVPRFLTRVDFDALEADRARQHQMAQAPGAMVDVAPAAMPAPREPQAAGAGGGATTAPSAETASVAPVKHAAPGAAWADFRGPNRDGRYTATSIRTIWPREGLPQLWKQPVGGGYASFVVAGGRAFTIEQRRDQEVVAAYDVQNGRELWTNSWKAYFQEGMGGDGPRATPTYHEGRVYALGAEGELRAIDAAKGTLVWRHNILAENQARNVIWGMSASPLIVDDKVIVLPGGTRGSSIVAYNKATGDVVWKSLNDEQGYTSPMLVTLGGVRQILVVSATRAMGMTIDEGRLLWEYPWSTFNGINVAQPILFTHNGNDRMFLSASYGTGAAVVEISRNGDRWQTKKIWDNQRMKNKFSSSVLHDGFVYGLDESILTCLDVNTGEQKWKGGRYGYGQIMLAGGHVIVLAEDGEVVLVRATSERHEEVARFQALRGKTWNHPAIADGRLLVRNAQEMAAYKID
ncbi:MAG TPA: PQQ-binding-like beta-propeller repeat protein [Vicinamibacterales bacterium]|nr:PQQ-binding-like beta-propeller repeat protein [Vicinamibacterales bacterium]